MFERWLGALVMMAAVGATVGLARQFLWGWAFALTIAAFAGWLAGGYVRKLKRQAERDDLTGVCNRRTFERVLDREWDRAVRHGRHLSLLFMDVDDFGQINKLHGHLMGDEALKGITRTIRQSVRQYDVVARWGGDEFIVLLPETDSKSAAAIAERIRSLIQDLSVRDQGETIGIGVSVGLASYPGSARTAAELIRHAVGAQAAAKQRKNAVAVVS